MNGNEKDKVPAGGGGFKLKQTRQDTDKELVDSFRGRFLDVGQRRKRFEGSLTNYERLRRKARKERLQYLLKRRQHIMQLRRSTATEIINTDNSEDTAETVFPGINVNINTFDKGRTIQYSNIHEDMDPSLQSEDSHRGGMMKTLNKTN